MNTTIYKDANGFHKGAVFYNHYFMMSEDDVNALIETKVPINSQALLQSDVGGIAVLTTKECSTMEEAVDNLVTRDEVLNNINNGIAVYLPDMDAYEGMEVLKPIRCCWLMNVFYDFGNALTLGYLMSSCLVIG